MPEHSEQTWIMFPGTFHAVESPRRQQSDSERGLPVRGPHCFRRSHCRRDSRGRGGCSVGARQCGAGHRGSPHTLGSPRSPLRSAAPGTGQRGASGASGGLCPAAGSSGGWGPGGAVLPRGQGLEQNSRFLSPWEEVSSPPAGGATPPHCGCDYQRKVTRTISPLTPITHFVNFLPLMFSQIKLKPNNVLSINKSQLLKERWDSLNAMPGSQAVRTPRPMRALLHREGVRGNTVRGWAVRQCFLGWECEVPVTHHHEKQLKPQGGTDLGDRLRAATQA